MTPGIWALIGLVIYAVYVYRVVSFEPEKAWKQREKNLNQQGIVARKPQNWDQVHKRNKIIAVLIPPGVLLFQLVLYIFATS